jgi:hypothetical protein
MAYYLEVRLLVLMRCERHSRVELTFIAGSPEYVYFNFPQKQPPEGILKGSVVLGTEK